MADYIPGSETEFNVWQAEVLVYASDFRADLELTNAEISELFSIQSAWLDAYEKGQDSLTAERSRLQHKVLARQTLEDRIRHLIARIRENKNTTIKARIKLGIDINDAL